MSLSSVTIQEETECIALLDYQIDTLRLVFLRSHSSKLSFICSLIVLRSNS